MFVALKIIPTIATTDTRRPSVVYNLDSPSSVMVSTVTTRRTPEGFSANVLEKLGATAAETVIATRISDDEVLHLSEWEWYMTKSYTSLRRGTVYLVQSMIRLQR